MSTFSGPVPPESNPPIKPQYFKPKRYVISAITQGTNTTITTAVDNDYAVGQLVRLLIPFTYGAGQLSKQTGYIVAIPAPNQVVVNINSLNTEPFIPSPSYGPTPPQIIAIGDTNTGPTNSHGRVNNITYIDGSFINISPA